MSSAIASRVTERQLLRRLGLRLGLQPVIILMVSSKVCGGLPALAFLHVVCDESPEQEAQKADRRMSHFDDRLSLNLL